MVVCPTQNELPNYKEDAIVNKMENVKNGNNNKPMEEEWRPVQNRRGRRSNTIQGTATESLPIEGAVNFHHFHVFQVAPHVTEATMLKYLTDKEFTKVKCEKMRSKRPDEYSSYKISVPADQSEKLKQPEVWPKNVRINRFFERLVKRNNPT